MPTIDNLQKYLIVGAGFSGAVLARVLAERCSCQCIVLDERNHIAGNCHTERDANTEVMIHKYGPHIFNTNNEQAWNFVNRYGDFRPFTNRVKACTARGVFSLPINLLTINQFFGKTFSPSEAKEFLATLGDSNIQEPANFEEQALKMLGRDLYETFFKGYTVKQWGCDPKDLPASVLKRLPVRFNYDDNYYSSKFQGIPAEGYTAVVSKILDHSFIQTFTGTRYEIGEHGFVQDGEFFAASNFDHLFFTGPLDEFFGFSLGRLGYRTVTFEPVKTDVADYQGNAVINYPDLSVPWTRIHEHKHFAPWETHSQTNAFREFSRETEPGDIPYYPKRLQTDKDLLARYRELAESQAVSSQLPNLPPTSFLGRLATYRYLDMDDVIAEALEFAESYLCWIEGKTDRYPVFPNKESA